MKYDPSKFTWGYEIEFGDINRNVDIPEHLGKWEYAETDIVNILLFVAVPNVLVKLSDEPELNLNEFGT